jgi:hypothetical protein
MTTENKRALPDTTVVTGKFRMAFPAILTPKTDEFGKTRYQMVMLFDADSPDIPKLKKALAAAMTAKFGPDQTKWPRGLKNPIKDGNDADPKYADSHAGKIVVSCSSNSAPGVVDKQCRPVLDPKQVYGGRWAIACVNAFYYDNKSKGVAFGLNHVQLHEDDTPFGGRTRPEDVFAKTADVPAAASDDVDDFLA